VPYAYGERVLIDRPQERSALGVTQLFAVIERAERGGERLLWWEEDRRSDDGAGPWATPRLIYTDELPKPKLERDPLKLSNRRLSVATIRPRWYT